MSINRGPMTALGLLEQMRRAGANREPDFNPVGASLRERRVSAPLIPAVRRVAPATPVAPMVAPAQAVAPVQAVAPAQAPAREPVAVVVPRAEAPPAVLAGIAARRALDPNSPTYFEDIQRINNAVIQQTLPGMAPQPVVPGYAGGGLADLGNKYAEGGRVGTIADLLARAFREGVAPRTRQNPRGLPMDEQSRRLRAESMGFDLERPLYHGTSADADFRAFRQKDRGVWTSRSPDLASSYAKENDSQGLNRNTASRVMPLVSRAENIRTPSDVDMETLRVAPNYARAQAEVFRRMRAQGTDAVNMGGGVQVDLDARNLRSPHATFDPERIREADILAGVSVPVVASTALPNDGESRANLEDLEQKYAEGGRVDDEEFRPDFEVPVVAAAPLANYQEATGQAGRRASRPARRAPRPAPREELTADQLNAMVLDILASRNAAPDAAVVPADAPATARDRIRRVMGYAGGGLAKLEQKYETGGRVGRAVGAVRRAVTRREPEIVAENPRAVIGGNNPPRSQPSPSLPAMTPDEAMAIATRPQPGAGVPRLEGEDLEQANELSQRVLDFRAAQMLLPPAQRIQPRPEDQVFAPARFDQPLEAGPSNVAQELEALRIGNIAPNQTLPGSRAAAGLASDLAERYGTTMDRIVGDLGPIARIMRGEDVPDATAAQIASARAGEFYNMRPVYDALRGQGVSHDEALRRIRQESQAIAGTSPRTDTEQNVLNSAFLQNRMARGLPVDASSVQAASGPGSGYGMIYDQHPALTQGLLEGTVSLAQNPKPTVFGRNISGDRSAVTADVHNVRAVNMLYNDVNPGGLPASSFETAAKYREYVDAYTPDANGVVRGMSDDELREILVARPSGQKVQGQSISTEYPIYNDITTRIAERLGLTPADAQALMWFHYGPRTGLASEAHTVPELLNQRISITSQALDMPPEEVLGLYSRNMIPLAGAAPATLLLPENSAEPSLESLDQKYAEGGEVMSDAEYDRRLLSRMKRDTGRTTEPTREEQMQALRTAGRSAVEGAADVLLPQSPIDFALMAAFGPGGRAARLAGSAALASLEPSEAEASRFRRLIRAYHASPYEFDTFDINKIGSGEGSQSYSNGFYFSENPALSGRGGQYDMKLRERFGRPANIYEVDIDSSPDRLIDWALPVSQQPGAVQDALRSLGSRVGDIPMYHALNRARRNEMHAGDLVGLDKATPSEVSARLRDAGVDGVRYLDIGTRGAGEGSQNYVIYRPDIIDITRRYAEGGLAELENKYAEGGEVSVMTYDPAAVDALAQQIEAEYV